MIAVVYINESMQLDKVKEMLRERELTNKGAVRLCLDSGMSNPQEIVSFLELKRSSFYKAIQDLQASGAITKTKTVSYFTK